MIHLLVTRRKGTPAVDIAHPAGVDIGRLPGTLWRGTLTPLLRGADVGVVFLQEGAEQATQVI